MPPSHPVCLLSQPHAASAILVTPLAVPVFLQPSLCTLLAILVHPQPSPCTPAIPVHSQLSPCTPAVPVYPSHPHAPQLSLCTPSHSRAPQPSPCTPAIPAHSQPSQCTLAIPIYPSYPHAPQLSPCTPSCPRAPQPSLCTLTIRVHPSQPHALPAIPVHPSCSCAPQPSLGTSSRPCALPAVPVHSQPSQVLQPSPCTQLSLCTPAVPVHPSHPHAPQPSLCTPAIPVHPSRPHVPQLPTCTPAVPVCCLLCYQAALPITICTVMVADTFAAVILGEGPVCCLLVSWFPPRGPSKAQSALCPGASQPGLPGSVSVLGSWAPSPCVHRPRRLVALQGSRSLTSMLTALRVCGGLLGRARAQGVSCASSRPPGLACAHQCVLRPGLGPESLALVQRLRCVATTPGWGGDTGAQAACPPCGHHRAPAPCGGDPLLNAHLPWAVPIPVGHNSTRGSGLRGHSAHVDGRASCT